MYKNGVYISIAVGDIAFLLSLVYSLRMAIIVVTETCSCLLTSIKLYLIIFCFIVRSTVLPLKISLYKTAE